MNSGAQYTIYGKQQAMMYMKMTGSGSDREPGTASRAFRFGAMIHESVGTVKIRLPLRDDCYEHLLMDVIPIEVFLLMGFDAIKCLRLIIHFADANLWSQDDKWMAALVFKYGHLYLEWPSNTLYADSKLKRVHGHYYHPSTKKVFAVI